MARHRRRARGRSATTSTTGAASKPAIRPCSARARARSTPRSPRGSSASPTYYELVHQEVRRAQARRHRGRAHRGRRRRCTASSVSTRRPARPTRPGPEDLRQVLEVVPATCSCAREAELRVLQADSSTSTSATPPCSGYYDDNAGPLRSRCARTTSSSTPRPEARAVKARARRRRRTSHASPARSATIESAAQNGGDLGCASPTSYVPEFADATSTQPVGVVGEPVQTQFGFHIIRRRPSVTSSPLDEVRAQIVSELSAARARRAERVAHRRRWPTPR